MVFSAKGLRRAWVPVAVVTVLGLGACGSADPLHTWAAKVNGETISTADLMADVRATENNDQFQALLAQNQAQGDIGPAERGTSSADLTAGLLGQRIVTEVATREAARLGVKAGANSTELRDQTASRWGGDTVFNAFDKAFQTGQMESLAIQQALVEEIAPPDPTAEDVAKYLATHPKTLAAAASVCARHILVETKSEADEIKTELAAGGDFAQLATTKSTDTGSGAQGGDLGCSPPSTYVSEFADAVGAAPIGQVVGPVKTEFGYHLILVTERQPLSDTEAAALAESNIANANNAMLDKWFADAIERADVEINPRFGSWEKRDGVYTVVPPAAA